VGAGTAVAPAAPAFLAEERKPGSTGTASSRETRSSGFEQSSFRDITTEDDHNEGAARSYESPLIPPEFNRSVPQTEHSEQDLVVDGNIETITSSNSDHSVTNERLTRLRVEQARLQSQRERLLRLHDLEEQERQIQAEIEAEESQL
jgi:hypothetical protein